MVVPATCAPAISAGMAALQSFYNLSTGLWDTTNWWNAANALETTIDYSVITQSSTYTSNLFNTFEKHKQTNFLNKWFNDDDGWWALTWIKAYDMTGRERYLEMAKTIFESMSNNWDNTCGGGVWWKKERTYKNAITNQLFMTVAIRLHQRSPGDGRYMQWANRTWQWLQNTGMLNRQNLFNDGLDDNCRNNGQTTWTYNQGVILGALVDMYRTTNDRGYLNQAEAIADAAIASLAPNGVLREPCEPDCGDDGPQFKGIFMRNLAYLYKTLPKRSYQTFITQNANAIWAQNRNHANQFGLSWAGPFDKPGASRQSSALDAINAAIAVNTKGLTCQVEDAVLFKVKPEAWRQGYQGSGYVASHAEDHQMTCNFPVACSGRYNVTFRYAAPDGDASRYIHVNGRQVVDNQPFPARDAKDDWQQVTVPNVWLNAGNNKVSVIFNSSKGSQNPLLLDEMKLD